MPLTVKAPGRSEPPVGVGIPGCGGLGSSFIHALTDHTYRPGSTLRGSLSHQGPWALT